jgi:hypothetical protein
LTDGHFFDEDLLGWGDGLVLAREVVEQSFEFLRVFAGDDGGAGGEAVREMVEAGFGFALG